MNTSRQRQGVRHKAQITEKFDKFEQREWTSSATFSEQSLFWATV